MSKRPNILLAACALGITFFAAYNNAHGQTARSNDRAKLIEISNVKFWLGKGGEKTNQGFLTLTLKNPNQADELLSIKTKEGQSGTILITTFSPGDNNTSPARNADKMEKVLLPSNNTIDLLASDIVVAFKDLDGVALAKARDVTFTLQFSKALPQTIQAKIGEKQNSPVAAAAPSTTKPKAGKIVRTEKYVDGERPKPLKALKPGEIQTKPYNANQDKINQQDNQ
jgi:hypothetical protein